MIGMIKYMLRKRSLFNNNSVCIFTDSAYTEGSICAGFCTYRNEIIIDQGYNILHDNTSQRGELLGIYMGIMNAIYYFNLGFKVRLFSDSLNSILAIRNRIFKWVQDTRNGSCTYLGQDGSIKNQDYIMNIIYLILYSNIQIEFYHVKGHVKIDDISSLAYAKEVFKTSNGFGDVEDELIRLLANANNQVDRYLNTMIGLYLNEESHNHLEIPITFDYTDRFDPEEYRKLVNNKDKGRNRNDH